MDAKFQVLAELIHGRFSEFPGTYKPGIISRDLVDQIVELARWAPNHKKTEPWRFVLLDGHRKKELADFLEADFEAMQVPPVDPVKKKKAGEKALQSAVVMAICIHRSPATLIPEWEETAALACSVQNIWLACTSMGVGAYWSTPGVIERLGTFLKLEESEQCLGLFYMGWSGAQPPERKRKDLDQIRKWL